MTEHIRPEWARGNPMSNTRAEDRDDYLRDIDAAARQAALAQALAAVAAAHAAVAALHRTHGLNLIDALDYLDYAREAVEGEAE